MDVPKDLAAVKLHPTRTAEPTSDRLEPLAARDVAAGRLVFPFDLRLPLEQAYHVLSLEEMADLPDIAAFRQWLLAQARADAA